MSPPEQLSNAKVQYTISTSNQFDDIPLQNNTGSAAIDHLQRRSHFWQQLSWDAIANRTKQQIELGTMHSRKDACRSRSSQAAVPSDILTDSCCKEITASTGTPPHLKITRERPGWCRTLHEKFSFSKKLCSRCRAWFLQRNEFVPDPLGRVINLRPARTSLLLDRRSQKPYVSNRITSSRYTVYNFLPRQLAFQFSKVANIYFLSVSILQMIPGLSTTGTYTTIIPLSIFLAIAIAREGYDDLRRHRMDTVENNTPATRVEVRDKIITELQTTWQNLRVGDIVKLEDGDWVPADVLLLKAEQDNGIAYIETAALDGETNLKLKRSLPILAECCHEDRLATLQAVIESESPNKNLYNYEGKLTCGNTQLALTSEHVIYRGSILRNTPTILAVILFTGEESKIRLNASAHVRIKRPSMQALVNRVVMAVAAFVICLSIFCTSGFYVWHDDTTFWYLDSANSIAFFPIFVSFLILFNTMVPLSLYVSMEIVKLIQQLLLQQDIDLYHAQSDTPAEARTATINEELGQVTHIFTDKTGTLTNNEMIFRRLSIAGHAWLHETMTELEHSNAQPFLRHKVRKDKVELRRRSTAASDTNTRKMSEDKLRQHSLGNVHASHRRTSSLTHGKTPAITWKSLPQTGPALSSSNTTMDLLSYISNHPHTVFARRARAFLLSIALCHTVLPSREEGNSSLSFSSASPDESALVEAAMQLGYVLMDRTTQSVTLRIGLSETTETSSEEVYQILDVIEFSSNRKRMSIVIRFPDGRICIMCKGADSVLLERLRHKDLARKKWTEVQDEAELRRSVEAGQVMARKSLARPSISRPSISGGNRIDSMRELDQFFGSRRSVALTGDEESRGISDYAMRHSIAFGERSTPLVSTRVHVVDEALATNESLIMQHTFQHLHSFASEGLRVLMYGHRFLSTDEYLRWKAQYHEAITSLSNRQERIEQTAELIERDLEMTGVTAIEDKLQDGVPSSIDKLHRAGIKMWMLTGDKRETAINIGLSTGLIKDYSTTIILDHNDPDLAKIIATRCVDVADHSLAHSAVVVDGLTLSVIEADAGLLKSFVALAVAADATICCRASPSQKAALVQYVRKNVKAAVTLAIGDGANDIAMIKEAHVGIGITGKEGLQAARSSDYSIAQFRFLVKLLLVHGRWNYMRICKYVLGTFYKEILLFLTQAIFQRFAGYTGTSLHESWSLSLFNTLFSSLAVICLGAFEKDLSASTLLAVPELYETTRMGKAFSIKIFIGWMLLAASQAVLCFYFAYLAFMRPNPVDLFPFGHMIFTAIVIVINIKLIFLEMHSWSVLNYSFFGISFIGWWIWSILQAALYGPTRVYFVQAAFLTQFGRETLWWAAITLVVLSILLFDVFLQVARSTFRPSEEDKFRELQADSALKSRLEEEAAQELQAGWVEDLLARRGLTGDTEAPISS